MKKILIVVVSILVIASGVYFGYIRNLPNPEASCHASNGGWAPAFFAGNDGPLDSNGKPITRDSSLIERGGYDDGYTCYCHTPNTGWNGEECVPIAVK
jgi:hypothetical protein